MCHSPNLATCIWLLRIYLIFLEILYVEAAKETGELADEHQQHLFSLVEVFLQCHFSAQCLKQLDSEFHFQTLWLRQATSAYPPVVVLIRAVSGETHIVGGTPSTLAPSCSLSSRSCRKASHCTCGARKPFTCAVWCLLFSAFVFFF